LTKLFLAQQATTNLHLVNINSIGGTITSAQNGDYSASKFALTAFTDALRQEMSEDYVQLTLTNIYPYFINTGLYEGFKPLARL
jgi:short-subunit dehydrogenase